MILPKYLEKQNKFNNELLCANIIGTHEALINERVSHRLMYFLIVCFVMIPSLSVVINIFYPGFTDSKDYYIIIVVFFVFTIARYLYIYIKFSEKIKDYFKRNCNNNTNDLLVELLLKKKTANKMAITLTSTLAIVLSILIIAK